MTLIWSLYTVYFEEWQPDQSHQNIYHFGELVALDPEEVPGYDLVGAYHDPDFTEPAPLYVSVTGYEDYYFNWQIEAGQTSHVIYWHHDQGVDSAYTAIEYADGYLILFTHDTPKQVSSLHGFWFEGWYHDPDLTNPASGFFVNEDRHLYPSLVAADSKRIEDIYLLDPALEPYVSIYGTVSYIGVHRDGTQVNAIIDDGLRTIMIAGFEGLGYTPMVGDNVLVSGYVSEILGAYRILMTDVTLLYNGDGTFDYSTAADASIDLYGDGLVQLQLYYDDGVIFTDVFEDGVVRYYLETADGYVYTIHSQSTHLFYDGEFHHCLEGTDGKQGRLVFYYAWNNVVYAVPGGFTEAGGEDLIYQAIAIPWLVVDDYHIYFDGGTYGVMPTENWHVVLAEFPVGTEYFYVDFYFGGDLVGEYTLGVYPGEGVHFFSYDGVDMTYSIVDAAGYEMTLEEMINSWYTIYLNDYWPGYDDNWRVAFGETIQLNPGELFGYSLEGIYFNSEHTSTAWDYLAVTYNAELFYNWQFDTAVYQHTVYWHLDNNVAGDYISEVYSQDYLISQDLEVAQEIAKALGYWFEGWYLDPDLTIPMAEFNLTEDVHLYPKFVDAATKSTLDIQSADLGQRVSLYGTVSYQMIDANGYMIGIYLTDEYGSVIVSFDDALAYWPMIGDQILISGIVNDLFGYTNFIHADLFDLLINGDGTFEYAGATNYLDDVFDGSLPSNYLFYATGLIREVVLDTGVVRYYLDTLEGDTFIIHPQSTHEYNGETYVHWLSSHAGETGTLVFYAGWNNVIYPVPGQFTTGEPEELIYQAIMIPWAIVDDFQVTFDGGIYGIVPTENPNVFLAEFPLGTQDFYVDFFVGGEPFASFTLEVDPSENGIHYFIYVLGHLNNLLIDTELAFGVPRSEMIVQVFPVYHRDYIPGYDFVSYHQFGEYAILDPNSLEVADYVLDGIYLDPDFIDASEIYLIVIGDTDVYYKWSLASGVNQYFVYWHQTAELTGDHISEAYAEGYLISPEMDTAMAIASSHGYWFEGWYLDPELTQPMEEFALTANQHLYPKLTPASEKTIADLEDTELYSRVSLEVTISYIMTDSIGTIIGYYFSDETGTILGFIDDLGSYQPVLGDLLLVSGTYDPIFGSANSIATEEFTLLTPGDGTYVYSGAVSYLDDVNAYGELESGKLYFAEGLISEEALPNGILRYYLDTVDGYRIALHPQSVYFLVEGSYVYCMSEYVGTTGTFMFYGAWYLVAFPIPMGPIV